MYTGYKPSNSMAKSISSTLTKPSLINQSQLEALQREVDNYTRKLEQEKRRRFGIDETLQMVKKEHQEHVQRLKELKKKSQDKQAIRLHAKIKNLEHQLDQAISIYDQTVAHNNSLKGQIDRLRKQKKNFLQIYKGLNQQQQKYSSVIQEKKQEINKRQQQNKHLQKQIVMLEEKNQQEKKEVLEKFDMLEKQYKQQKAERQKNKMNEKKESIEMIDTQPVLRMRLKKLIAKNKQKVKIMDEYQRKMKVIEQAFNQIKIGSGISDIQEITNTFIKSQQQNYSLYNYVDILSQNIDNLTEQNKILEKRIKEQEEENQERKKIMSDTPEEQKKRQNLEQIIKKKEGVIQELRSIVQAIAPDLQKTLIQLAKSKFNDQQNKLFDYSIGTFDLKGFNINQNNIEQYLADLQKYVNILIEIKCAEKKTNLNPQPILKEPIHKGKAPEFTQQQKKSFMNQPYNESFFNPKSSSDQKHNELLTKAREFLEKKRKY